MLPVVTTATPVGTYYISWFIMVRQYLTVEDEELVYDCPQSLGQWFQDHPMHTKICLGWIPLYEMMYYLHVFYAHPPKYFKSSLDYLYFAERKTNSSFALLERSGIVFLEYFLSLIGWILRYV